MTDCHLHRKIIFHSVLSSAPATLVVASLPLLLSDLKTDALFLGNLYFLVRLGAVLGFVLLPALFHHLPPSRTTAFAELFQFFSTSLMAVGLLTHNLILISAMVMAKGLSIGVINSIRFPWLKTSLDPHTSASTLVITRALSQSAYGVTGIFLILGSSLKVAWILVTIDVVSSLIFFSFFFRAQEKSIEQESAVKKMSIREFLHLDRSAYWLIAADMTAAFATAGANILIYQVGLEKFPTQGGYAVALILYSVGFLIVSVALKEIVMSSMKSLPLFGVVSTLSTIASLSLFGLKASEFANLAIYEFFILGSAFLGLFFEVLWFKKLPVQVAASLYSLRMIVISLIWALGEVLFADFSLGLPLRLAAAMVSFFLLGMYFKNRSGILKT